MTILEPPLSLPVESSCTLLLRGRAGVASQARRYLENSRLEGIACINPPSPESWFGADALVYSIASMRSQKQTETLQLAVEFSAAIHPRGGAGMFLHSSPRQRGTKSLHRLAERFHVPVVASLTEALDLAIDYLRTAKPRSGPDRMIPHYLWSSPHFGQWRDSQVQAGNRIEAITPRLAFHVGPDGRFLFWWAAQVKIWVASESRYKENEIVFSRPDIHHVVAWHRKPRNPVERTEVLLIREFRSSARTKDGFIREVPGGSASKSGSLADHAAREFSEETGFSVPVERLVPVGSRQVAGTTSTHYAHCFGLELSEDEMASLKRRRRRPRGNTIESEQTYPEIRTVEELLSEPLTDWVNLGMILAVIGRC